MNQLELVNLVTDLAKSQGYIDSVLDKLQMQGTKMSKEHVRLALDVLALADNNLQSARTRLRIMISEKMPIYKKSETVKKS